MPDSMASLAFSVYSGRGVYAVLLGSGVSRSSGIPTGWEITLKLVERLAVLSGAEREDSAAWYTETYKEEPDYSMLLEKLAKSPGDRNFSLRPYFEPTEQEREEGGRLPTAAHKAIAELVAKGYIRVIVTTNFDRLMEQALGEVGVTPNVVWNADQAKGMAPLVHSRCTIIKVHGDYTDTRIKNTVGELATYEEEMDKLLDQVFDEYGLIVCGWSADWDEALRSAIERCPNRRFMTYWSAYSAVSGRAQELCTRRAAQIISGMVADEFFGQLKEKIEAIEALDSSRHPLSKQMAVASVKKYITEDRYRPRLHDLFMGEAERVNNLLLGEKYFNQSAGRREEFAPLVPLYESDVEVLLAMMIAGGFWGSDSKLWIRCLERVATASESNGGDQLLRDVALYPVRLLMYGCGVAAAASDRDETVAALLTQARTSRCHRKSLWHGIGEETHVHWFDGIVSVDLPSGALGPHPISHHFFNRLLPEFRDYISGEDEFRAAFNRFEYLAALVYADLERQQNPGTDYVWGPHGLFAWRGGAAVTADLQEEVEREGDEMPLLKAGAFGGSIKRLKAVKEPFDDFIKKRAMAMGFGWN